MDYIRGKGKPESNAPCLFCQLAADPHENGLDLVIARSSHCCLALNRYPYNYGHLLLAPFAHVPSPEALEAEALLDMAHLTNRALKALRELAQPSGFNIGANIGAAAGAGIPDHYHFHIVPRWDGDANFMATVGATRIIPDTLDRLSRDLKATWSTLYGD